MKPVFVLIPILLFAMPAHAQDTDPGKLLYETHCSGCHYERVHDRDPSRSRVHTLPELRAEVANRARLTDRQFTREELREIGEYLNRSHYRFKD